MIEFLRVFLPIYFLLYFSVCFLWRTILVWRRTGINPLVFGKSDGLHDFVGRVFKVTIAMAFVAVAVFSFCPSGYFYLGPLLYLEIPFYQGIGVILLIFSFGWTALAQAQMGNSWRIGIDSGHETSLVRKGLYGISRNPVFLGMIVTLLGLFLAVPNALSLLILVLGWVLIQIQVRLEEEFLAKAHEQAYREFCERVPRWFLKPFWKGAA